MSRRFLVAAFMAMLAIASFNAVGQTTSAQDAAAKYQALLAEAKQGDEPVDWLALRFAYADSPDFDVFGTHTKALSQKMFAAYQAGDFAGAVAQAEAILDIIYVDIDAHMVGDLSYQKLGNAAAAKRHHDAAVGLLHSLGSGDGTTPATAFTVITVDEEYALLRAIGLRPAGQALVKDNGHMYDRLDSVDEDGGKHSFYFLIDRVMAAEAAALKLKAKP